MLEMVRGNEKIMKSSRARTVARCIQMPEFSDVDVSQPCLSTRRVSSRSTHTEHHSLMAMSSCPRYKAETMSTGTPERIYLLINPALRAELHSFCAVILVHKHGDSQHVLEAQIDRNSVVAQMKHFEEGHDGVRIVIWQRNLRYREGIEFRSYRGGA